jgi:putative glutamine amidotransferase
MKPIIGITTSIVKDSEYEKNGVEHIKGLDMARVAIDYSNAVERAGGIPFLIPMLKYVDGNTIDDIISRIDGVIFTGGADIDPSLYNQENIYNDKFENMKSDLIRDEYEIKLLKSAMKLNKPVLGICRGCQLINVYFNGTLYQDIDSEYETDINHLGKLDSKDKKIHKININSNSELFKIYNEEIIEVNSFHHQAINKVGDSLKVIAKSRDGIIESIEYTGEQWILGLQYHPEMLFESDKEQLKIFSYFSKISNIKD